jgi:co-chaperonin GroES (HSP10)
MAKGKMNLEPLDDRVVVKPGEEEEMTVSGIVIPDTEVKIEGEEYLVLSARDILAIVKK